MYNVTVLLYLTHLFVYSIVIWEGFLGGRGEEQRDNFNGICSIKIDSIVQIYLTDNPRQREDNEVM